MPGINVVVYFPYQNGMIGRSAWIYGEISQFNGVLSSVSIEFGGTMVSATVDDWNWSWQGTLPASIHAGQSFPIRVSAFGFQFTSGPEPEPVDIWGSRTVNVTLENFVPVVTVNPFQSPINVTHLPYAFTMSGTATENGVPGGVQLVQYQIGTGPFINATPVGVGGTWSKWNAPLSLPAGDHVVTIRANDAFGGVTTVQKTLSVALFDVPAPIDPNAKLTLSGVPTTSSITSWTRLEPQCTGGDADIGLSTNARVFDPLWMLTRQWQVGEFQAEDAGTPVQTRVRATSATITRCHFGALPADTQMQARLYDPKRVPLEAMVERRPMRAADAADPRMLPLAVEAGLHFLRMLESQAVTKYRAALITRFALQPLSPAALAAADDGTARFVQTMIGRAPDARRLATLLRTSGGASQLVADPVLAIATADRPKVQQTATAWLAWYDALFSEPTSAADDAWIPSRLEYGVSVSTRMSQAPLDEITMTATEFDGGLLDWSSFDRNLEVNMGTMGDQSAVARAEMSVPSPVTFRGMPAPRFWEMEDARVAYGLLPVGPTDLAQLMMIEYASTFGNDWFVVPLTVPVGSVTRVDSLVVTDSFGVRSLLRPIGDPQLPNPHFSMWQPSRIRYAGNTLAGHMSNQFFLPPTIGRAIDSTPVEDVLLMRDEMANLAWAIERSIEAPTEQGVQLASYLTSGDGDPTPAAAGSSPRYRLSSTVPDNWIPLLPVQLPGPNGKIISRLKRGVMRKPDGTSPPRHARSEALNASGSLLLYDEEIPREGIRLTRARRMTRWIDGASWVWTGFRASVGRGEGSAGLRFDHLDGEDG